ncbi:MAG: hypothetical protein WC372_12420 [Candidatus Neomarinimicrobiota bacterium]
MTNDEPRLLGDYITRREHGSYPVGSKCVVYRKPNDILLLKMEDGGEVELDGRAFHCPGLTPPPPRRDFMDFIRDEEDAWFFAMLDKAVVLKE